MVMSSFVSPHRRFCWAASVGGGKSSPNRSDSNAVRRRGGRAPPKKTASSSRASRRRGRRAGSRPSSSSKPWADEDDDDDDDDAPDAAIASTIKNDDDDDDDDDVRDAISFATVAVVVAAAGRLRPRPPTAVDRAPHFRDPDRRAGRWCAVVVGLADSIMDAFIVDSILRVGRRQVGGRDDKYRGVLQLSTSRNTKQSDDHISIL